MNNTSPDCTWQLVTRGIKVACTLTEKSIPMKKKQARNSIIHSCKVQDGHDTEYSLPDPDADADVNDLQAALDRLEDAAKATPSPGLDDELARRLSHATRAPAAAMLAATWSPRIAEPLQGISPALAAAAHAEMLNGYAMTEGKGIPNWV